MDFWPFSTAAPSSQVSLFFRCLILDSTFTVETIPDRDETESRSSTAAAAL